MEMVGYESQREGEMPAERTCAGCRDRAPREALLRFACVPGAEPGVEARADARERNVVEARGSARERNDMVPDFGARLGGRGAWVHARGACLRRAARGGFARALRSELKVDFTDLRAQAVGQLERRVSGLLLAAQRRRAAAVGTDAVRLALAACTAHLLLVAKDAAGRRDEVIEHANERGVSVIELFSKSELGRLTGKDSVGLLALLDARIAREVADSARWLAGLSEDG